MTTSAFGPSHLDDWDPDRDLGKPGVFPFTRGIYPEMHRRRLWTMRQYAGFGTATESNERYRYLLSKGVTGLSVAFDLPTQMGYDSDHQLAAGEVGRVGVAIDSLDDMEAWTRQYFSDIKDHNLEKTKHDPNPLEKKETFRLVQIDPVKDLRDLEISFSLPSTRDMYESKPGRQLGFILGHEGEGSLLSYLKDKGWARSLSAGAGSETKEYGLANIRIGLTQKGQNEYKKTIKTRK